MIGRGLDLGLIGIIRIRSALHQCSCLGRNDIEPVDQISNRILVLITLLTDLIYFPHEHSTARRAVQIFLGALDSIDTLG